MDWLREKWTSVHDMISGHKHFNILLLGLEESGKTSVIFKLKNYPKEHLIIPTLYMHQDTIDRDNTTFIITEVTGRSKLRQLWKYYFNHSQGVIYVIDSNNSYEFSNSRTALENVLEELNDLPFLILINKRDIPESMTVREITIKLSSLLEKHGARCCIQASSATEGIGLEEGLEWLQRQLAPKTKKIYERKA